MAAQKPTPEEKLFAVIQGVKQAPIRKPPSHWSLASAATRLSTLVRAMDVPRLNRLLAVGMALLGALCVLHPVVAQPRVERLLERATAGGVFHMAMPLEGLRPVEEYADAIRQHDPFRIGEPAVVAPEPPPVPIAPPIPEPDPRAALADYKLVGISWGAEPTAMIEQVSTQQTHFIKPGDTIGVLTVKEILVDHVVLRTGEQDLELF